MLLNNNELMDAYEDLKEMEELLAPTHKYSDIAWRGESPIDEEYHSDEDIQKLKAPVEVDKINGLPIAGDEKRHLIVTGVYNEDKDYSYQLLYDMSGDKPKFIAGGNIELDDGLVVIDDHLYQVGQNNDLSYVTSHVHKLLGKGFFTKYPGGYWDDEKRHDEHSVCHCDDGGYKRLVFDTCHFVRVTPKGNIKIIHNWNEYNDVIIDIYELNYDKENSLIKTVFRDHIEGTRDLDYSEYYKKDASSKTPQELEFEKNRQILEEKRNNDPEHRKFNWLFYFKRNEQSGKIEVFEKADKEGKNPLLEVDSIKQLSGRQRYVNQLVYAQGDVIYQAEVSKEGKIVPKLKVSNNELFFSKGNVWQKVKLEPNEELRSGDFFPIHIKERGSDGYSKCLHSTIDAKKFDDFIMSRLDNSAQKEKVQKVKETYYNNKERLKACRDKIRDKSETAPAEEAAQEPMHQMGMRIGVWRDDRNL